jgi:hypothetical protein
VWASLYQAVRIDAFSRTGFPTKRRIRHDSGICANRIPSQLEQYRFFLCLKQKFDCRAQNFTVDRKGVGVSHFFVGERASFSLKTNREEGFLSFSTLIIFQQSRSSGSYYTVLACKILVFF